MKSPIKTWLVIIAIGVAMYVLFYKIYPTFISGWWAAWLTAAVMETLKNLQDQAKERELEARRKAEGLVKNA